MTDNQGSMSCRPNETKLGSPQVVKYTDLDGSYVLCILSVGWLLEADFVLGARGLLLLM